MEFPALKLGRSCALSLADEPAYVLSFAVQSSDDNNKSQSSDDDNKACLLAAALSDSHNIKIYDQDTFCSVSSLEGHTSTITGITFDKTRKELLWSSSMDGTLRLWNISKGGSGKVVFRSVHGITCFDINSSGKLLALALEQDEDSLDVEIHVLDITEAYASGEVDTVATFDEIHSDDVTKIMFHPQKEKVLFTCSMDGLIAVLDLSVSFDEDVCLLRTLNIETSVSSFGFFGASKEFLFVLTHIETLQLWDYNSAEMILRLPDVRKKVTEAPYAIDYIIDCLYHAASKRLFLIGGTNTGTVNLLHINLDVLEPVQSLNSGHSEVVRCLARNEKNNMLFSGAEDGMVCAWVALKAQSDVLVKGKAKAKEKKRIAKAKPYSKDKRKKSV